MQYSRESFFLMVIIVSFLGFCLENIWLLIRHSYVDNRNMRLPFLTGYGLTLLGFYLIAGIPTKENQIAYFAFAFAVVSLGEILMGKLTERIMHIYYWDYSSLPLHITRYTSVPTSLGFAAIIVFFMKNCFTSLMERINALPVKLLRLTRFVMPLLLYDMLYCYSVMYKTKSHYVLWRYTLPWRRENAAVEEKHDET